MEVVIGLLVILLRGSHGVENYCDSRQDGARCYGALGGTVDIQLMDSASEIFNYQWKKNRSVVLHGRKNNIVSNLIESRSFFTPSNGTFTIKNLSTKDGGEYTLQIFDSDGQKSEQRTLRLSIQGVETSCDGRQDGAQCYGALGGTVVVQLMDSASEIFIYQWKTKTSMILLGRKNKIMSNLIENRSFFTPSDGTFRINNLIRTDSGQYTLELFNSNGQISEQRTLHLSIQAPVSSVQLVSECLSQGEMRVSCSSEGGDSPQYSWTLDGHTLTDTELLSGNNEMNIITLKQDVSGHLVCSVRNHVSSVSRGEMISTCVFINCTLSNGTQIPPQWVFENNNTLCIEPTTSPTTITDPGKETVSTVSFKPSTNITSSNQTVTQGDPLINNHSLFICGLKAAVAVFSIIGIFIYFAWKKKKSNKAKGCAVPRMMDDPDNSVLMVEL